jgi:hypothetical protein
MAELVDGLTGSVDQVLTASPIDNETKEPFKWKIDMSNPDGIIATARHGPHTYTVSIDKVKVSVRTDSHAEIEAAAKAPAAKKPVQSVEEMKALADTKTVSEQAPDAKTKKEAQKVLSSYKK